MNRACIVGVGQSVESFKDVEVLSLDGATGRIWTEKVSDSRVAKRTGRFMDSTRWSADALGVVPVIFDVPT